MNVYNDKQDWNERGTIMNNKKILSAILGISCIVILIGVFVLNRKPEPIFTPEATETTGSTSWGEKHLQASSEQAALQETTQAQTVANGSSEDLTQVVVTETSDEVITELTPSTQKEQVQADTKPKSPPTKPQPEPEQKQEHVSEAPAQSDSGHEGQVYDPVFGWITPSPMQGQISDNDGDINKQVGTMN